MAIKVLPLTCSQCGNNLEAKNEDIVFICKKCLIAYETRDFKEYKIQYRSYNIENSEYFLPFFYLYGEIIEKNIEIQNIDNISYSTFNDITDDLIGLGMQKNKEKVNEEIMLSAANKLVDAKKVKPPYKVEILLPAFKARNLMQYGFEYGKLFYNSKHKFKKIYQKFNSAIIINSEEAILISENLILNKRSKENSYIFYIDYDWNVEERAVITIGFNNIEGILVNQELDIKVPLSSLTDKKKLKGNDKTE